MYWGPWVSTNTESSFYAAVIKIIHVTCVIGKGYYKSMAHLERIWHIHTFHWSHGVVL